MTNIPEKAKEVLTALTPTKAGVEKGISSAKDMIFGSGYIREEITRVGKDYMDIPKTIVGTPLKAMGDLWNKNPIGALQDIATGVKELSHEALDIVSAPVRGGIAATATAGRGVKAVATAPVKGVLAVGHVIGDRIRRLSA